MQKAFLMKLMAKRVFFSIISKKLAHTGEEWIGLGRNVGWIIVTAVGAVDLLKEKDPGRGGGRAGSGVVGEVDAENRASEDRLPGASAFFEGAVEVGDAARGRRLGGSGRVILRCGPVQIIDAGALVRCRFFEQEFCSQERDKQLSDGGFLNTHRGAPFRGCLARREWSHESAVAGRRSAGCRG